MDMKKIIKGRAHMPDAEAERENGAQEERTKERLTWAGWIAAAALLAVAFFARESSHAKRRMEEREQASRALEKSRPHP